MALPTFAYRVLSADSPVVIPDAVTGAVARGTTILKTYRLEGNLVRRIVVPGSVAAEVAHPEPVAAKKRVAVRKKLKR